VPGTVLLLVAFLLGGSSGSDRNVLIAVLQRRSASAVPGTAEAREIAREMGRIGSELLAEGEPGPALELLGEAYALDESNGDVLAELTLASVRVGDLDSARFHLQRAGLASGGPADVYRALGEELETLQRLDDAAAAWSEAARLSGQDPPTLRRLARVRDELAVSRGQRTLSTGHFELFADPAVSDHALRAAADGLEESYARLTAGFPLALTRPQVVVLYSGRAYFSLVAVPDWVAGVYDGKIRVSVDLGGADGAATSAVLAHELAHAVLRQAAGERATGWLHEGFAQWSAGRRMPRDELGSALSGAGAPTPAALETGLRGRLDRHAARSLYAQSLSLVEHLVAERGEGALACVVARLAADESLNEALVQETGWTEGDLFASWARWASE
jgi:tetratricopeptide (TPR) repeat protein